MIDVITKWYQSYFTKPEAVILAIFLLVGLLVITTMGKMLAPILASIVIAYVLEWAISLLERLYVPRKLAILLVFILFIGLLILLMFGLLPLVWQQMVRLLSELPSMVGRWQDYLMLLPERYPDYISETQITDLLNTVRNEFTNIGQYILSFSLATIPNVVSLIIYLLIVPILIYFFLMDREHILTWFSQYMPQERGLVAKVWSEVHYQLGNYVRGKVAEMTIVGIVTYVTFTLMGMPYSILLAVLVGVSVLVPYVGAAVVTIPVALVAFFQWGFSSEFAYLILAYGIIQALDGNFLVPVLFSEAVSLHPIAIIVTVIFFGGLWGFWGIFFAIPLAILIKAVLNAWPKLDNKKINHSNKTTHKNAEI